MLRRRRRGSTNTRCMRTRDTARSSRRAICRSALRFMKKTRAQFSFHRRDKFLFVAAVHIALASHSLRRLFAAARIAARRRRSPFCEELFWVNHQCKLQVLFFALFPQIAATAVGKKPTSGTRDGIFQRNEPLFASSALDRARRPGAIPKPYF